MFLRRLASSQAIGGLAAIAVGGFAIWEGGSYPVGSARQMGPGYFPVSLGLLMLTLGAVLCLEGLRAPEPAEPADRRAFLAVIAGIAAFALLLGRLGLVPATFALVLVASAARPGSRPLATLLLAAAISGLALLLFRQLLGLPLPAWRG
jgi:hypothetical protein